MLEMPPAPLLVLMLVGLGFAMGYLFALVALVRPSTYLVNSSDAEQIDEVIEMIEEVTFQSNPALIDNIALNAAAKLLRSLRARVRA